MNCQDLATDRQTAESQGRPESTALSSLAGSGDGDTIKKRQKSLQQTRVQTGTVSRIHLSFTGDTCPLS